MDLYSAEAEKWKSLIQEWLDHPNYEIEATFGLNSKINVTTFLDVAKRLKSKGYQVIEQDYYLNICLQDKTRVMINGLQQIKEYCEDDIISNKSFTVMRKDRNMKENNLDITDYDFRVKMRREEELGTEENKDSEEIKLLLAQWATSPKTFRMIHRWSFEGNGVQFDLSMVRTSQMDRKGNYKFVRKFTDYDVMTSLPVYEIEIELKRSTMVAAAADEEEEAAPLEDAFKSMVRGVADVLRGIQRTNILIRKDVKNKVLADYYTLSGARDRDKNPTFRGVATKTLLIKHMTATKENERDPSIRDGYNVTDKADGLRVHAFTNPQGELFMIDQALNIYKTGLKNEECADSLLDGEWVRRTKNKTAMNSLLLFDAYIVNGDKVDGLPFASGVEGEPTRYKNLTKWTTTWTKNEKKGEKKGKGNGKATIGVMNVLRKSFEFGNPGDGSIFGKAAKILDGNADRIYHTDGLIFTANSAPLPKLAGGTFEQQFKWKPADQNTIDFMIYFEKDDDGQDRITEGFHPDSGNTVRYKTLRLLVGSSKDSADMDPRASVLRGRDEGLQIGLAAKDDARRAAVKDEYKPVTFVPLKYPDTMASVCYLELKYDITTASEFVTTKETDEPINDKSIVEMAYNPINATGWRWEPLRVRHDKNEKLARGIIARTLNSFKVAEDTWNSIHEPITERMIRTGADEMNEDELAKYTKEKEERLGVSKRYWTEKRAPAEDMMYVKTLREFHNAWIKGTVLLKTAMRGGGKTLVDIGCGRGGDLHKWTGPEVKAAFVLGIDPAGEDIRDPKAGAYRRLLSKWDEVGKENVPPIVFVIADARELLVDGSAGLLPEEKDILRSVFGRIRPEGAVPKYIDENAAGRLKMGADVVSCMFAMHYFFENVEILNKFITNLTDIVRPGGYFIGCCFDGENTFKKLKSYKQGEAKVGEDHGTILWRLTKQYSNEEMPSGDESVGLGIDVEFISIGQPHREYLVNFTYFTEKMHQNGFELLNEREKTEIGLKNSSAMFEESWTMAKKLGKQYPMSDTVKEFSFMNRWFIFKKVTEKGRLPKAIQEEASNESNESNNDEEEDEDEESSENNEVAPLAASKKKTVATAAATGFGEIETIPTTKGIVEAAPRKYAPNEIFLFHADAGFEDKLKIDVKDAGRWLSPLAPFDITDPETGIKYPTVEHYLAGMKVRKASPMPEFADKIFGVTGPIHQKYIQKRLAETGAGEGAKKLTEKRNWELLKEEWADVKKESLNAVLKKTYKIEVNEAAWAAIKDDALGEALKQRFEQDVKFRSIVLAAKDQGKILLYYQSAAASELGGVYKEGKIQGDNKLGRMIMILAGFPE